MGTSSWGWGSLAQWHGPLGACPPEEGGAGTWARVKERHEGPPACSILCYIGHYQHRAEPDNHTGRPLCHKAR